MTIDRRLPSSDAPPVRYSAAAESGPSGLRSTHAVGAAGVGVLLMVMLTALVPVRADAAMLSSTAGPLPERSRARVGGAGLR